MSEPGTITDEGVVRLRGRIGIAEPHPMPPHYRRPGLDAFRHVANAYGDDNPLWCDPSYGSTTFWDSPIAPPPLVGGDTLVGEDEVTAVAPEHHELMKGDPLRGVHALYGASAREWWAPLFPDRQVFRRNALVGALDKPSEFAAAHQRVHGQPAAVSREDGVLTLVDGPVRDAGKYEEHGDEAALARLGAAANPVMLVGPGVVDADAVPSLHAFATAGSLGVLNTWVPKECSTGGVVTTGPPSAYRRGTSSSAGWPTPI